MLTLRKEVPLGKVVPRKVDKYHSKAKIVEFGKHFIFIVRSQIRNVSYGIFTSGVEHNTTLCSTCRIIL